MRLRPFSSRCRVALLGPRASSSGPQYARVYTLKPKEGVFAYARISPDGDTLVYASEKTTRAIRTGSDRRTMVDLASKKILSPRMVSTHTGRSTERGSSTRAARASRFATCAPARSPARRPAGTRRLLQLGAARRQGSILTIASNYYYLDGDKAVSADLQGESVRQDRHRRASAHLERRQAHHDLRRRQHRRARARQLRRHLRHRHQGREGGFLVGRPLHRLPLAQAEGPATTIQIVDLQQHTVRTLPGLSGSALFPSWTKDGRLCFRYDGPDYRGFMMASNVLDVPAQPLPAVAEPLPRRRTWRTFSRRPRGPATA